MELHKVKNKYDKNQVEEPSAFTVAAVQMLSSEVAWRRGKNDE